MTTNSTQSRLDRYRAIIASAGSMSEFALSTLKMRALEEQPAFITRTIRALEQDGHVSSASDAGEPTCRWASNPNGAAIEAWIRSRVSGTQITSTPLTDRPRERLLANGAASLRTAELLAILIRTGKPGESALQAGEKIANHFVERLDSIPGASRGELKETAKVVGDAAYCQIMAGIELGRRVAASNADKDSPRKISNSEDAIAFCRLRFERLISDAAKEEFHILCLDTKNQVIDTHLISVGTLDASLAHPREIFRPAIKDAAAAIILVHNHPSGDPTPSREDARVTDQLKKAGEVERENPKLKGVLNKNYTQLQLPQESLIELINLIAEIPFQHEDLDAKDILGHVYEYFLGQFALAEGKKGGQCYTPKSIVNLIVDMLEPFKGRVYDPADGQQRMVHAMEYDQERR